MKLPTPFIIYNILTGIGYIYLFLFVSYKTYLIKQQDPIALDTQLEQSHAE